MTPAAIARTRGSVGALLLAVSVLAAGCSSTRAAPGDRRAEVFVNTINENFYDARIHAVYGDNRRHALGTVPGNGGESEATIPWEAAPLSFVISFVIDGRVYQSIPIDPSRGEHLELRLPSNIDASGFFRRVQGR